MTPKDVLTYMHKRSCFWKAFGSELVKRQPHKMVKYNQTIRRKQPANFLSVFDHFVGLVLKALRWHRFILVSITVVIKRSSNYSCNKKVQPMSWDKYIVFQKANCKRKITLKQCERSFSCNLTVDTNNEKQFNLTFFRARIEKLLGEDLTSTEIDECLLEFETVNIA